MLTKVADARTPVLESRSEDSKATADPCFNLAPSMTERDRDKDLRPYAAGIAASERTRTYSQRVEETCPDSSDAPLMGGPIRV